LWSVVGGGGGGGGGGGKTTNMAMPGSETKVVLNRALLTPLPREWRSFGTKKRLQLKQQIKKSKKLI